jgi:hypothetical protein
MLNGHGVVFSFSFLTFWFAAIAFGVDVGSSLIITFAVYVFVAMAMRWVYAAVKPILASPEESERAYNSLASFIWILLAATGAGAVIIRRLFTE